MIYNNAKSYCRDDVSKIKNYELAIADTTQTWECHHWNEQWFTRLELIKLGRYYNVPADELVFMTHKEHSQWHCKYGAEQKGRSEKLSESSKGRTHSEETKQKLSESNKGKNNPMYGKTRNHSGESRRKMSETHKGENNPMFGKKGENNPNYGKTWTPERRAKYEATIAAKKGNTL